MNYSQFTLDQLLDRVATLNRIKAKKRPADDLQLTQAGLDRANEELSAIDAELSERQPAAKFVTLHDDRGKPVGISLKYLRNPIP